LSERWKRMLQRARCIFVCLTGAAIVSEWQPPGGEMEIASRRRMLITVMLDKLPISPEVLAAAPTIELFDWHGEPDHPGLRRMLEAVASITGKTPAKVVAPERGAHYRIYISSTYEDLKDYREVVYRTLRQMGHDVIAMEDYVAGDDRPLDAGLKVVAECGIYIGIFAWRYGYVPEENNPEHRSVTELEYRHARALGKPCLIFLLDEETTWPTRFADEYTGEGERGRRIRQFREELTRRQVVKLFKTPGELASLTSSAIVMLGREGSPDGYRAGTIFRDRLADGSEGPELVVIPAGEFWMGSDKTRDPEAYDDELPRHRVSIAKAFALGRYPVTFAEYERFAEAAGRKPPEDQGWGREDRPVINVSWEDALAYCAWLSEQTGRPYRLPTEAEWEYAARAGTETRYWWGDEAGKNNANCNGCGSEWDNRQTAPVGSFRPSPWGLHDMLGNVWEWLQDCWHDRYEGAPEDGSAWEAGDCSRRVVRGGSWFNDPRYLRSADRSWYFTDYRNNNIGFRLAQDL